MEEVRNIIYNWSLLYDIRGKLETTVGIAVWLGIVILCIGLTFKFAPDVVNFWTWLTTW